jgi:hypothetical protein
MSRFEVNKLMAYVDADVSQTEAFAADPEGFVGAWEQRDREHHLPTPDAGTLTDEERAAFIALDWGTLYAMGAHPYLLLHIARAVEVGVYGVPFPEFNAAYKAAVTPHGYPDFET